MTTALDIITDAAKLLGVVRKGEALDADEAADGLRRLNAMLGSWSNNSLNIYARTLDTLTFATSALSYTIGSGATFNTTRPVKIISAVVRSGSIDYPVTFIDETEFESIPYKTTTGSPELWGTYDNAYPTGTLRFYPKPTANDVLRLLSEKPLSSLASTSTTFDLPPGHEDAVVFNLAVRMAPYYGVAPSNEVKDTAKQTLGAIRIAAAKAHPMPYNPPNAPAPNIYTG